MISNLVPITFIVIFAAATLIAAVVHRVSGNHQKITLTFLGIVLVVLWLGNDPHSEPFPGAIKAIVIMSTVLQLAFAGIAYWVRDRKL